ncbi:MAG: cytochrome c biogenesis protein CcdA [Patescibacteria group bacterium]
MNNLFFGVSLTAAFAGGMVALFAPCCITFLFPSYLGTIFKEKKRVVFLTLIFALGLGTILIPVAVGFRFIVSFFNDFHTTVYLLGALVMFLIGLMTLLDIKIMLPVPHRVMPEAKDTNVVSTYILGVFSGITSSCCAPVLFAALTLSTLSPSLAGSLIVSIVYVMGIVFPLFFLSLFYEKMTNTYLYTLKKRVEKPLKIVASFIFMLSAIIISYMTITNRIQMDSSMEYGRWLRMFIYNLSARFQNPGFDILIIVLIITFIIIAIRQARRNVIPPHDPDCPKCKK